MIVHSITSKLYTQVYVPDIKFSSLISVEKIQLQQNIRGLYEFYYSDIEVKVLNA